MYGSNRYSEDWVRFLIWYDPDGNLSEQEKSARLHRWYGNNRYTYLKPSQLADYGIVVSRQLELW